MLQLREREPRLPVPEGVRVPRSDGRRGRVAPRLRFPEIHQPDFEIDRFIEGQLERWAGRDRMLVLTVPAPRVEPEALLDVDRRTPGLFWEAADGAAFAGAGAAHTIRVAGPHRFRQLRLESERLWRRLTVADYGSSSLGPSATSRPRLFGGLAFAAGAAGDEPWSELGDGCFTLPRFLYRREPRGASLSLALDGGEIAGHADRGAWRAQLGHVLAQLARRVSAPPRPAGALGGIVRVHGPSRARWTSEVEAIRRAIARGDFSKIVAAQRSSVELAAAPETAAVLRRLARTGVTRFAFRHQRSSFLGATPERLIARQGRQVETEALAGSIGPGDGHAARLLASGKDRHEHALVVDEIVRRLAPMCGRLSLPASPGIRQLRDVLHLRTPITGTLAVPRHVLELVEALHPTPAVGGLPSSSAMRWIQQHESGPRGWYASPVGWFDVAGDGEFAVALRCCVLRGSQAHLYAGAGIVGDSDPNLEYHETELKRRALLSALGA